MRISWFENLIAIPSEKLLKQYHYINKKVIELLAMLFSKFYRIMKF